MKSKVLSAVCSVKNNVAEIFTTRFSNDGSMIATGCADGFVRVNSATNGSLLYSFEDSSGQNLPVTSIRFRPYNYKTYAKNVLLIASSDGQVYHWHVTSGKVLSVVDESKEDNQVYALDYNRDGSRFCTGGKDRSLRIYDDATQNQITKLRKGTQRVTPGHSNRVFSVKFKPLDENLLISGGWDNTVQIWDMRTKRAVRSIFGPHICGDSVDIKDNTILTGSWRPKHQLQLWDFGTGKLIENISWHEKKSPNQRLSLLYCAQFSKLQGRFIAAGGSGANECKIFDTERKALVGTIAGLSQAVFSVDFDQKSEKLAVAGGDTTVRIFDLKDSINENETKNYPRRRLKKKKSSETMLSSEMLLQAESKIKHHEEKDDDKLMHGNFK